MKSLLLLLACAVSLVSAAQPATSTMVEAEKSFAAFSVKNGTREAFLAFVDSNAVLFSRDSFTNGMQLWLGREKRPGILDWKPVVAELARSGDWGFTTGPFTFTAKAGDTATSRGHFFTIWHKAADGQWKFLFDCGAEGGREPLNELYSFQAPKLPGTLAALMQAERDLAARLKTDPVGAHQQYLSVTSVLVRNGQAVAITPGQQTKWFRGLPASIISAHSGHLMAPSNDMALIYGTIISGTQGERKEPFLRLWRHEPGGWRLAAELLRL
ncbi:nuclear transport factor 2 family protein [Flaviaesturariibacter flavus]|uniref:Nuclear transport factor 2 family protein n=1 Tax=Flaviaesturariibacter flavus TaxID=2502780 RepID=A0A4R1B805_9BACT|nr:nuclear transport factor 2 family protein [Flaviaesturariibacter flavus]TCJ12545.1 nuclear transport factor 2 family protein [Flaviaesturariibacter flavus]